MRDAKVARFSDWRADRERRERQVLKDGLAAGLDALYEWIGRDQDVRIALVAMYGDPYAGEEDRPEAGRSVPVEAEFISLDGATPLTSAQRRHLAIETMRAASEGLYREMALGLRLADLIEDLATAAEAGDHEAETRYGLVMAALKRREMEDTQG
ncbi:MAG TPA: hypothetical protein VK501_20350 [Baekduia sp.]|uniref:hypothetical protein n=1 Tax=Baekduia sp. TaxID=2600305 RepID=UPI002C538AC0|nr:hypothetical protein [Baekduia sp.]HMJ36264.1 hypothetical protein [Baekduia sp.]